MPVPLPDLPPETSQRFWRKVRPMASGCWEWQGCVMPSGYGQFRVGSDMRRAHRVAYASAYGGFGGDLHVLHSCDNRICCRPDHLFLGTNDENVADKVSKGRQSSAAGESHGRAKLSEDDVRNIRSRYQKGARSKEGTGCSAPEIANEYGVTKGAIVKIGRRALWGTL